jgi:hypothetical protein
MSKMASRFISTVQALGCALPYQRILQLPVNPFQGHSITST